MTLKELISSAGIEEDSISVNCFTSDVEPPYSVIIKKAPKFIYANGKVAKINKKVSVEIYTDPDNDEAAENFMNTLIEKEIPFTEGSGFLGGDQNVNMWIFDFDEMEEY